MSDTGSAPGEDNSLRNLVAEVAAAYFANSHVAPAEIPAVIAQIAASLGSVGEVAGPAAPAVDAPAAAKATRAQIRKSLSPDALISFEDGKPYKALRRHLATRGLTPAGYRAKWGLPDDYPMVAPSYSEQRSQLARSIGLGQRVQAARGRRGGKAAGGRKKAAPPDSSAS